MMELFGRFFCFNKEERNLFFYDWKQLHLLCFWSSFQVSTRIHMHTVNRQRWTHQVSTSTFHLIFNVIRYVHFLSLVYSNTGNYETWQCNLKKKVTVAIMTDIDHCENVYVHMLYLRQHSKSATSMTVVHFTCRMIANISHPYCRKASNENINVDMVRKLQDGNTNVSICPIMSSTEIHSTDWHDEMPSYIFIIWWQLKRDGGYFAFRSVI